MVHFCGSCRSVNVLVFSVGLCGLGLRGNCCFKTGDNVWTQWGQCMNLSYVRNICFFAKITWWQRMDVSFVRNNCFLATIPCLRTGLHSLLDSHVCAVRANHAEYIWDLRNWGGTPHQFLKKVCMYNSKKKLITMARHSLEDNLMVKMHNLNFQLTNCTKSARDIEDLCHQFCKIIPKDFQHIRALVTHHL